MFFLAGCNSSSQITEHDVQSRFQAAQSIKDNAERDNALCSLAFKAAKAGMDESTEDIIKEIGRNDLRDSTNNKCALLLAKQGKITEATRIAKSIKDNDLRDKTLAKIAEQQV
jgi:hypothetical protein